MSLYDNYEAKKKFYIDPNMTVEKSYKDQGFPGNSQGTCAAQVLMWCKGLAGQLPSGKGIKEPLLTPYERSTSLQFGPLENGKALQQTASRTVDLRQKNTPKLLRENTPWSGKYKLYGISNNRGEGHIIGAYFPWTGPIQFYDPNLVVGSIKSDGSIYDILSVWVEIYRGCGGPDAIWGHETLFVIDDPAAALKKIGA